MRDLASNIVAALAIAPIALAGDEGATGITIDTMGYDSCTFFVSLGTLADAAFTSTITVQSDDDSAMGSPTTVADADLVISANAFPIIQTDDDKVLKIGYVGNERYVRLVFASTGNASSLPISAIAILGHPHILPQTTHKV
jgi:hypothetical protein